MSQRPCYSTDEAVHLGDVVDVGRGNGPRMRVVVVIPTQEAALGFNAADWEYLKRGVILQDSEVFGLLHLEELDDDSLRVDAV